MTGIFQTNLERWRILFPDDAKLLEGHKPIKEKISEVSSEEAEKWFQSLSLQKETVVYIYGVGLGNYFLAAKKWLAQGNRYLIFLEDDLDALFHLFHTEAGKEMLHNKQVRIQFFRWDDPLHKVWQSLAQTFSQKRFSITAWKPYLENFPNKFQDLFLNLSFYINNFDALQPEFSNYGYIFYSNFYQNVFNLPNAYQASGLFEKYTGMPAIICGAGPSLDKNLALLETLADRALIFAGGTAMNAVNSRGFLPHFGVGIDPNETHYARIVMNTAFEVPYLYRSRIYPPILKLIQGMELYVTQAGGHAIPQWFEEKLGIESPIEITEGLNVINFSLSLATAMGCNPIILVGMDLSYSDDKSYQSGVESHAMHSRRHDFRTKTVDEELISRPDIYGKPVFTLWKWITESAWISDFANNNPNVLYINSTEGGIGMAGLPNKPLQEVADHLLLRKYDFRMRVHGEIQNSHMPSNVTQIQIQNDMRVMAESLERCKDYCQTISNEFQKVIDLIEKQEKVSDNLMTKTAEETFKKLLDEDAYKYILGEFNEHYLHEMELERQQIIYDPKDPHNIQLLKLAMLHSVRFNHLVETASFHSALIYLLVREQEEKSSQNVVAKSEKIEPIQNIVYSFENKVLRIEDPELNLYISDEQPLELYHDIFFYSNERVKTEQYLYENLLHGPVTFFSQEGKILAQNWYVKGVQQGRSWYYYLNGSLYYSGKYLNGHPEGEQKYYYPNGTMRSILNYKDGKLHGKTLLFYPNEAKKREINFSYGKRDGMEWHWSQEGNKLLEAEYRDGKPIHKTRKWHWNGQLALETIYSQTSERLLTQEWDEFGMLIPQSAKDDFVDSLSLQINLLTASIDNLYEQLSKITPLLLSESEELRQAQKDFELLHSEISHLKKIGEQLLIESGLQSEDAYEPIWKSTSIREELQEQLKLITSKLKEEVSVLQNAIAGAIHKCKDK